MNGRKYTIDGTIKLRITRNELTLLVSSLRIIIPIVKERHENSAIYERLLADLNKIEEQWYEKEKELHKSSKRIAGRRQV